jgi:hypothetical protein
MLTQCDKSKPDNGPKGNHRGIPLVRIPTCFKVKSKINADPGPDLRDSADKRVHPDGVPAQVINEEIHVAEHE